MKDSLSGISDLVLSEPMYNGQSKAEKAASEHDVFIQGYIGDLVELLLEVIPLGAH